MTRKELIRKYATAIAAVTLANPKEDGTMYDMGVGLDMLVSDMNSIKEGKEPAYKFEGMDAFDWTAFEADYNQLP